MNEAARNAHRKYVHARGEEFSDLDCGGIDADVEARLERPSKRRCEQCIK